MGEGSLTGSGEGSRTGSGEGSLINSGDGSLTGSGDGSLTDFGDGSLTDFGDGSLTGSGEGSLRVLVGVSEGVSFADERDFLSRAVLVVVDVVELRLLSRERNEIRMVVKNLTH